MLSLYQPWTALQRQLVQKSIDEYAKLFTRGSEPDEACHEGGPQNAGGRVRWQYVSKTKVRRPDSDPPKPWLGSRSKLG